MKIHELNVQNLSGMHQFCNYFTQPRKFLKESPRVVVAHKSAFYVSHSCMHVPFMHAHVQCM